MPCRVWHDGNGVTIFECDMTPKRSVWCDTCGSSAVYTCEYPLSGVKSGQFCGRNLCGKCYTSVPVEMLPDHFEFDSEKEMALLCPVHNRLVKRGRKND